ncbi:MAG TPA: DUF1499 domain-containing protein [Rhizomicrobium sp.]|nr:DUF1499 domain-containing protein [Rhizomicrobium sp.]
MRFPFLAARLALAAFVLAALIAGAAIAAVRVNLAGFTTGLEIMTASVALGLIALILALIWMFAALKDNRSDGKRAGLIALIGSAFLLYVPLHTVYEGMLAPPIYDATTDPEDPPQFVALAKRPPGANSPAFNGDAVIDYRGEHNTVSYMLHTYYAELTKPLMPIMPTGSPTAKMFWRCFNRAKDMGWQIVDFDEKQGRIEARTRSFWFGRVSDIVIRIRPAGTLGARFDMRAQTETGSSDFGHDLELIKTYRATLNS